MDVQGAFLFVTLNLRMLQTQRQIRYQMLNKRVTTGCVGKKIYPTTHLTQFYWKHDTEKNVRSPVYVCARRCVFISNSVCLFCTGPEGTTTVRGDVTSPEDYTYSMLDAFVPLPADGQSPTAYCRCKRGAVVSDTLRFNNTWKSGFYTRSF